MKIVICNLSSKSDEKINGYINSFNEEVSQLIKDVNKIEWEICNIETKQVINNIINKYNDEAHLIENTDFLLELNETNIFSNKGKLILIGEQLNTINLWGDAVNNLTLIKKVDEKNVWHEISHIIGTEDHYDDSHNKIDKCQSETCIMQYGKLDGTFCDEAIKEMKRFFQSLNS